MSTNRRNFLKNSAIGFAGAALVNPLDALGNNKEEPASGAGHGSGKDMDVKAAGMTINKTIDGWSVYTNRYRARIVIGNTPMIHLFREGWRLMRMPAVSGLATVESPEKLENIIIESVKESANGFMVILQAVSSIWQERRFFWEFGASHIRYWHEAKGPSRPGRCYFFSNDPTVQRKEQFVGDTGTIIDATETYSPGANLADEYRRAISIPQSLGILPEKQTPFEYGVPDRTAMIFAPPMLCLPFGKTDHWIGVGIGTKPGAYQFNSFEYAIRNGTGQFFVNYLGYTAFNGTFTSPVAAMHFGYSPHEVLEQYVSWMDSEGFSTPRTVVPPAWHYHPVFCGWTEQSWLGAKYGQHGNETNTQANYEEMMEVVEKRRLPVGTLIIDDKWQEHHGTFRINTTRWPDMAGFVRRQHEKGLHVLLWTKAYAAEGLPDELCVHKDGKAIFADVSNPLYLEFLRERVRYLVHDIGIDGFKLDYVWGITREPGLVTHAPLHGIEWLRQFQTILYNETHRWRPDALIETHSACPVFRDCSDMLRLNDLNQSSRNTAAAMEERSRLAHIAGWPLVDCDNSGSTLNEWWNCMQAQPRFGVPSLYLLSGVEYDGDIPDWMWESLRNIWIKYIADCDGSVLNSNR